MKLRTALWRRPFTTSLVATAAAATTMIGCAATGNAQDPDGEQRIVDVLTAAFARGVGGEDSFFAMLADDVRWTVARAARPTTYTSRSQFLTEGAGPVQARLTGPIRADVRELIVDDDVVVALWDGTATARDGQPYRNSYAWVMTMRGDRVAEATAYLDMVALDDLLQRVSPA